MGIIVFGAVVYLKMVKGILKNDAIQAVMDLTIQQALEKKAVSTKP